MINKIQKEHCLFLLPQWKNHLFSLHSQSRLSSLQNTQKNLATSFSGLYFPSLTSFCRGTPVQGFWSFRRTADCSSAGHVGAGK